MMGMVGKAWKGKVLEVGNGKRKERLAVGRGEHIESCSTFLVFTASVAVNDGFSGCEAGAVPL